MWGDTNQALLPARASMGTNEEDTVDDWEESFDLLAKQVEKVRHRLSCIDSRLDETVGTGHS